MGENGKQVGEIKYAKAFFCILAFVLFVVFILGQVLCKSERDGLSSNCELFTENWERILDNGERVPIEVPGKVEAEYGEVVTISTYLPENFDDNEVICFRSVWQDVEVYIDGELRASYNTDGTRPVGKNSAFRYIFVELEEEDAGKEIQYSFSSESKYAGATRKIYIGDKLGIWTRLVSESGVRTIITVFLLFLSLFCAFVCAILKFAYKKALPLTYLVWTMFFCSLWMLSEVEFRQIIFKNISALSAFTYFSLMIIPIPLSIYINDIQGGRYKKFHTISLIYAVVMFFVTTCLQAFNIVEFVQMVPLMHVGIGISIVCTIATITIDLFKKSISGYLSVGIGVYGLLFSALVEMYFYYVNSPFSIGTVLAIGLIFLLVMAIIKTGQDLMRSEKKKQEAIVAREAQARFLANMSHEIRTPINAVVGMNEMILRESNDDNVIEYAENIKSASTMLLGLVSDILDFSKIESGQYEIVEGDYDLISVIRDEKLILNTRAGEKQISIKLEVDPKIPSKLYGDDLRIKQIITNLISNAVKYTEKGSVTLKVHYETVDADNINLKFSVIDTGIGIKEEDMAELFDNFKRLELDKNRNVQGTGLGLSIAKQLAELMNGKLSVKSEYGKGSEFTLSVPQKVVDKKPIGNIEEVLDKAKGESTMNKNKFVAPKANMLIVDDNSMNLSVIKSLLKRTEIQVDTANGGKKCLELAAGKKYDIILLDHMMPELDGVETLQKIRENSNNPNKDGIIIALTANAIAGSREMYLEYGFTDYFTKPIQAEKLDELLLQYLPNELIEYEDEQNEVQVDEELLVIDESVGLSYSAGSKEIYKEILAAFLEQSTEYLVELEEVYKREDWAQYGIITHAIKTNSLNIGASKFSEMSLRHEQAGKNSEVEFIKNEYAHYILALKMLNDKVENMLL